jgi:hypothetical protein
MKPVTEAWLIKAGEALAAIRVLRENPQLTGVIGDSGRLSRTSLLRPWTLTCCAS